MSAADDLAVLIEYDNRVVRARNLAPRRETSVLEGDMRQQALILAIHDLITPKTVEVTLA